MDCEWLAGMQEILGETSLPRSGRTLAGPWSFLAQVAASHEEGEECRTVPGYTGVTR